MNHTNRVILLLLLIMSGCHKLNNKFSTIELECGSDVNTENSYIKFLHNEDTEISQTEDNLLAFHVHETAALSSNGQRLQATSKGCVAIPKDGSGRLDVFTKVPRQGLSVPLQKSQPEFSKQRLLPIKENYFGFVCPLEGYFAVDSLSVPLVIPAGPSSLTERNRIVAFDEATKREVVLFEKPFGETSVGELKLFNTSGLMPGEYLLKSTREVIDLRSETQLTSSDVATCPLTIVEKSPNLPDAILRLPASSTVPLGSKLSWTTDKLNNMKFCRKQGEGCSTSNDFREAAEILNQDEGIWDYCFLLENKVGQKSEILCKEIKVSGTKPEIKIALDTPAVSTDLSILDFPATRLKYKVQTEHKFATKDDLQKSQMCRVEFSFHGQVSLATDTITCLSKECDGKSLKDFAPCGSEIEVDISGIYRNDLIDKAYLKFIVRAEDGAGNISTRINSVLIDKDRWEYVTLTGPNTNLAEEQFVTFFPITDGRVHIFTRRNKLFEYSLSEQTWKELLDLSQFIPEGYAHFKESIVMPDSSVYSLWHYGDDDKSLILRRKPGKSWEHLTGSQSPPNCSSLSKDLAKNLYCQDEKMAYVHADESWKPIPLTNSEGAQLCYGQMKFYTINEDSQRVFCGASLYTRKGDGPWVSREEYEEGLSGDASLGYAAEDKNGNVWLSSSEWSDEFFLGYYDSSGQWNDAVKGKSFKSPSSAIGFVNLSRSGEIQYGNLIWDSTVNDWKPLQSALNALSLIPLDDGTAYESYWSWDSSLIISVGKADYLFTFPSDRWRPRSQEAINYHSDSEQFFAVVGLADSSTDRQLVVIRKRQVMNWLPVVTDSQVYDDFQLARQNSGDTFFVAGQKLIYRQDPQSGSFEVYRRFSDKDDVYVGTTGEVALAYFDGKKMFDVGGGNFVEFKIPKEIEIKTQEFLKDGKVWALDEKNPTIARISPDGSVENLNLSAECYGGSSTIFARTESHIYLLGGANMCMASFDNLIFKPFTIPGYAFETGSTLVARLSMSRLALRGSAEDSSVSIIDLEKQALEGPFTLPTENLLNLQESPRSRQLFALYSDRIERLINGKWEIVITSEEIATRLGKTDLTLKTLVVDREDSFLLGTDDAPLVRIFLK